MTAPSPMERHAALVEAVRAVVEQARGKVRHDDAERSGVTIHAGLLRALAESAGLDPLPPFSATLARAGRIQAYLSAEHWCGQTGE